MQSTIYLTLGLFSTYAFAQSPTSSDVANQIESLGATVLSNPAVSSELAQAASSIPTSLLPAVESALPTIESDVVAYLASLADTPSFTSVNNALNSALPSDVAAQLSTAPADFFVSLVTETAYPSWASALPTDVVDYFSRVNAHVQSIEAADVIKELPSATVVHGARPTGPVSGKGYYGHAHATGTGRFFTGVYPTGTGGSNGISTAQATASPSPFNNAASRSSGTLSIAMLVVGAAAWLLA
ncbi:hypothetical protein MMC22_011648 [Lobaria immixta]|nr:hypothetical protein [Lobaria immixta]